MKKVVAAALVLLAAAPSHAALQTVGRGEAIGFDSSKFPQQARQSYETLKGKCTRCHSLERLVVSYNTGIAPVSGRPFDADAMKSIIFGMMRKAAAKDMPISKDEAKAISGVMKYMLDESVR